MEKIPNILSGFRLAMAPVFLVLFIQDDIFLRSLSLFIFLVAALTDIVDGYVARAYNVETKIGIFLDPLADKFLTLAGFICLPFLSESQFPWWAIILIALRDLSITLLRIYTDRKGIVLQTRNSAKAKTVLQMAFLYVALLLGLLAIIPGLPSQLVADVFATNAFYWGLVGVTAVTVYTGVEYIWVNREMLRKISA
ncbi:MAG: CDP-alcohol phosphatidyltransferase family protein [Balneolaceae bacterium]